MSFPTTQARPLTKDNLLDYFQKDIVVVLNDGKKFAGCFTSFELSADKEGARDFLSVFNHQSRVIYDLYLSDIASISMVKSGVSAA